MADNNLPYQDPATVDRRLDSESLTGYDGGVVHRERVLVTGVNATTAVEVLSSDPVSNSYGMVVRDVNTSTIAASVGVMDDWDNAASDGASVSGDVAHDSADAGEPVKIGGVARTANPTAVAGGDRVNSSFDTIGRQIMRPVQVRGLVATAYATLSNGTETTLLAAGGAGVFHDLVYVMGANTSSAAIQVDIRGVSGGNIMFTIELPAQGTAGVALPVPIPQSDTNNDWTADMGDFTNTTVYLSALFSKEI